MAGTANPLAGSPQRMAQALRRTLANTLRRRVNWIQANARGCPTKSESQGSIPAPESEFALFRFDLAEIAGALGDLGTLIPLLAGAVALNGISPTGVFVAVGIAYILAGGYYRLPIPVQPMKAIAAVAIAQGLSGQVITAAAWWMAVLLLMLAATGAVKWVAQFFTRPITRGIQLGLGLLLIRSGFLLAGRTQGVPGTAERVVQIVNGYVISPGWLLAATAGLVLLVTLPGRRIPASIAVLLFGIIVSVISGDGLHQLAQIRLRPVLPVPIFPEWRVFPSALVMLVIPQLPLTLGNAVFATVDTANTYFGPAARRVTPRGLLVTMGISNSLAALVGGIPVCHGSGGLTAHHRLGARSGMAPLIMGSCCLAVGLFLDGDALPLLAIIPYPVLGTLLVFVGIQHSLLARDLRSQEGLVTISTAACGLLTRNLSLGFAAGLLVSQLLRVTHYTRTRVTARTLHQGPLL